MQTHNIRTQRHWFSCSAVRLCVGVDRRQARRLTSVHDDASVSEHLLEWLVKVLPTGFADAAGDAAWGELMPLNACERERMML